MSIYGGIVALITTLEALRAEDLAKPSSRSSSPDIPRNAGKLLARHQGVRDTAGGQPCRSGERRHDLEERRRRLPAEPRQWPDAKSALKVVTSADAEGSTTCLFAFTVCKHVGSSTGIVYAPG